MRFAGIIAIAYITFFQFFPGFLHNTLETDFQYLPVFYSNMSYAIIEIISRCKDIMFDSLNGFRCHIGSSKFTGCSSLPVFICFQQISLSLLCNIKWVSCSGSNCVQFSLQPFIGKFREGLTSSGSNGTASYNQFIITDNNRNMMQNMCKCFSPAGNDRFTFRLLIRFRQKLRSGRFNHRHMLIKGIYQLLDSRRFGNI